MFFSLLEVEHANTTEWQGLEGTSRDQRVQPPYNNSHMLASRWILNIPVEGDPTAFLFQSTSALV